MPNFVFAHNVPTGGGPPLQVFPGVPSIPHSQPNELFVGNLSFFCTERDLFELFSEYAEVVNVRIARNEQKNRSLMFGFVAFGNMHEAREMSRLFQRHIFQGRNLR
jgi:RNA recognition motif-containing protein